MKYNFYDMFWIEAEIKKEEVNAETAWENKEKAQSAEEVEAFLQQWRDATSAKKEWEGILNQLEHISNQEED